MSSASVAVVGAGVIGLSVAYHLAKVNVDVTIVDRDPEGDKASLGNAGGIAVTEVVPPGGPGIWWQLFGWIADPLGPLSVRPTHALKLIPWLVRFAASARTSEVERISTALAALNGRVYDDFVPMLEDIDFSGELYRHGALSLYETESGFQRDAQEWRLKRARGVVADNLTGDQARELEPALGPGVCRAVFTPQWSHISDPKRLLETLRGWLFAHGVPITAGEVCDLGSAAAGEPAMTLHLKGGRCLTARRIVVAAGAWSASLAAKLGDRVLLESERGYNTTLPEPGVEVRRELIFAERKFVATPLSCGLRIGGGAEFGGLNGASNLRRANALLTLAHRYLPNLRTEGATQWAGHRPATPDGLPVIGLSPREPRVVYAFGHGHLGLTQAATTGRLIRELILGERTRFDLSPYGIERFGA